MKQKLNNKKIAVWFSCGAASAIAAKETIEKYGKNNEIRVLNTPISEEHPDNLRFKDDVEKWLGVKIEKVVNSKFQKSSIMEVFGKKKFMSSPFGAVCTKELKKQARYEWEDENNPDYHVLGFTYEEKHRYDRFIITERSNTLPILIEKKITKTQCFIRLMEAGIKLPEIYRLGFPNANCIGCVKSASPTYWNLVRKEFPERFNELSDLSKEIGAKLVKVKGERIFLEDLKTTDTGRELKNIDTECGIFCEER